MITGSIVLYKSDEKVKYAIESFLATRLPVKLFLVDNSPTDALKTVFSDYLLNDRIEYIFNNANLGFGAAHNIAIKKALDFSTYHLVLNPDVLFSTEVLPAIYTYMEKHENVGSLMPKILYPSGQIQYLCKLLPSPADLIFRRFLPNKLTKRSNDFFEMRFSGYDKIMEVPYLSGCFMFLRIDALKKVGLFDERFFMYPEDIDLTRRINRCYSTIYYPFVQVVHIHAKQSYKSLKLLFIHVTNMVKYFNKWGWIADKQRRTINQRIISQFR